jgi:formylglycine-generating enzyme required for sulfatase activity
VRISRSFAVATKEVTTEQFQRFLDDNPEIKARFGYTGDPNRMSQMLQRFSPDATSPQIAVTWYEAAMYSNWLSKKAGLPESEWVYPKDPNEIRSGMSLSANYLRRTGYRLPTEAEWEYVARSGSTTSRFFGTDETMLGQYAWYSKNPPRARGEQPDPDDPKRTLPVGRLKPNDFGMFDIYGNVWELCMDRMQELAPGNIVVEDREDEALVVSDGIARSRRGGAFPYGSPFQRSANRDTKGAFPHLRRDNVGFRVARTLP